MNKMDAWIGRNHELTSLFARSSIRTAMCWVMMMGLLFGCESPREEVWLDDVEGIPVLTESSTSDAELYSDEYLAFDDYFEHVGDIQLSDELAFGTPLYPVVGPQGQILLMGRDQAGLFDGNGQLIRKVDPSICHPGFDWQPRKAAFLSDGSFLVFTLLAQGFWFDPDGECTKIFPHRIAFSNVVLAPDSSVYANRFQYTDWQLLRLDGSTSAIDTVFAGNPARMSFRIQGGGLQVGPSGDVYMAVSYSPFVYQFQSGRFNKLGYAPDYFRLAQQDMTEEEQQNVQVLMQRLPEIFRSTSQTAGFYRLDNDHLLLMYLSIEVEDTPGKPSPMGIHVMDNEGMPVIPGPLLLEEFSLWYAGNGSIYGLQFDESGLDDAPLNPRIIEYRFKPSFE